MIEYDWVDCTKKEYEKHFLEPNYRMIPIYSDEVNAKGFSYWLYNSPEPIGYKYQKGINPRIVYILSQKVAKALEDYLIKEKK